MTDKYNREIKDLHSYVNKAKKAVNYGRLKREKPLVVVLMGLPGSGKSYLANFLHKKYSFTTLSGENITHAIFGTEKISSGQYKEAYEILRTVARELLDQKLCLVVDGTNLKYEFRKQIYEEAGKLAEVVLFYLVVEDDVALNRANSRGEEFGDPKKILSKCPPETFESFKLKLELPREKEKCFKLKSDETLFEQANNIVKKFI
ncbi:ATP-binding protein [Candidatus Parcubacteria bacterium]|nr:MAG: ATP-binding protein [Candidatus Parcubacteria bacterium]